MLINLKAMKNRKKKEILKDKKGNIFCSLNSICPEEADIYEVPRNLSEQDYDSIINKLLLLNTFTNIKHVQTELLSKSGMKEFLYTYKMAKNEKHKDTKNLYINKRGTRPDALAVIPTKSKFRDKMVSLSGD